MYAILYNAHFYYKLEALLDGKITYNYAVTK